MFSDNEIKLMNAPTHEFPLITVAQRAAFAPKCGSCRGNSVNAHSMLRLAVNKYKSDKNFIEHCKKLFPLPTSIAGVHLVP